MKIGIKKIKSIEILSDGRLLFNSKVLKLDKKVKVYEKDFIRFQESVKLQSIDKKVFNFRKKIFK